MLLSEKKKITEIKRKTGGKNYVFKENIWNRCIEKACYVKFLWFAF